MLSMQWDITNNPLIAALAEVERSERTTLQNRSAKRYPINLEIEYQIQYRKRTLRKGKAITRNISSKGFLLALSTALPSPENIFVGHKIIITVPWPVTHHLGASLKFTVEGRICRIDENGSAVAVCYRTYEFQTCSSNLPCQSTKN